MAKALRYNKKHFEKCHYRWMERLNRIIGRNGYKDEWLAEQCGSCNFFIPLTGAFIEDWGGCSNVNSEFDGIIRFEHDGCRHYEENPSGWS